MSVLHHVQFRSPIDGSEHQLKVTTDAVRQCLPGEKFTVYFNTDEPGRFYPSPWQPWDTKLIKRVLSVMCGVSALVWIVLAVLAARERKRRDNQGTKRLLLKPTTAQRLVSCMFDKK